MSTDLIKSIQDATPCYVLYDTHTFEPVCSSGSVFAVIPNGTAQATISYANHTMLIESPVRLNKYYLNIVDGIAEVCLLTNIAAPVTTINKPNTIKDLNPLEKFFDYLGVTFKVTGRELTVNFDQTVLSEETVMYFEYKIKNTVPKVTLSITEYNDPTKLYELLDLNFTALCINKQLDYTLSSNYNRVSVWAIK